MVNVSPLIVVVTFVPPAIVSVSPGVIAVEPVSPATVVSETTKSISPFVSSYVTVIPVLVPPVAISGPAISCTCSFESCVFVSVEDILILPFPLVIVIFEPAVRFAFDNVFPVEFPMRS